MKRLVSCLAAAATVSTLGACVSAGGGLSGDPAAYGSSSSQMAVERFLDAADDEDYARMGQQFGTRDGPAEAKLGIADVEQRMVVLSGLLQHDSYEVQPANLAQLGPDRERYLVRLRGTRYGRSVSVPFIAVSSKEGRWFVERINVQNLTSGRR